VTFKVHWSDEALAALTSIWLNANTFNRKAISEATAEIDRLLAAVPSELGESRQGSSRILFMPPIVVTFSVHPTINAVKVLSVRSLAHRP